jgi:hypothetical protein
MYLTAISRRNVYLRASNHLGAQFHDADFTHSLQVKTRIKLR